MTTPTGRGTQPPGRDGSDRMEGCPVVIWNFVTGFAAVGAWVIGVYSFIRVFMTKPRSMKQVDGE